MRDKLISAGVKNLKTFGYPDCNKDNILTDQIYKAFFTSMLKENKGHSKAVDKVIDDLLLVCETKAQKPVGKKPKDITKEPQVSQSVLLVYH